MDANKLKAELAKATKVMGAQKVNEVRRVLDHYDMHSLMLLSKVKERFVRNTVVHNAF